VGPDLKRVEEEYMNIKKRALRSALLACATVAAPAALAAAPSAEMLSQPCAGCHGLNGVSAGDSIPSIAGMPESYLEQAMTQFKDGKRYSSIMGRIAKGYSADEIKAMAGFFAKQKWVSPEQKVDPALVEQGKKVHGADCGVCHGDDGRSQTMSGRLAGQWREYLEIHMHACKELAAKIPQPAPMQQAIDKLNAEDMKALANFYASQR
jgi:sulfide dehydrogenase cytochrome subunit